eukprot:60284-Chlamydomonas_euryale.AAC.2
MEAQLKMNEMGGGQSKMFRGGIQLGLQGRTSVKTHTHTHMCVCVCVTSLIAQPPPAERIRWVKSVHTPALWPQSLQARSKA